MQRTGFTASDALWLGPHLIFWERSFSRFLMIPITFTIAAHRFSSAILVLAAFLYVSYTLHKELLQLRSLFLWSLLGGGAPSSRTSLNILLSHLYNIF